MKKVLPLIAAIGMLLPALAAGHDFSAGDIKVDHPWTRETPPGAPTAAGYMTIYNNGDTADYLMSATAKIADRVEIHQMEVVDGVMKMAPFSSERGLEIPANGSVAFVPGKMHLMLVGLSKQVTRDQSVPVTLDFKNAGTVTAKMIVYPIGEGRSNATQREMEGHSD